jgi:sialate O-acetylesterase
MIVDQSRKSGGAFHSEFLLDQTSIIRAFVRPTILLIAGLLLAPGLQADVSCPLIFSDHMVLQRDRPIAVWGEAAPSESVTVEFDGKRQSTVADGAGHWRVSLDALPANTEARALTVRGNNTIAYSDVLVGDVWFCSGQSNMEKPLGPRKGQKPTDHYEEEIRQADHPLLRLYQVTQRGKPQGKIAGLRWLACTPDTVASTQFSAAAYFFGCKLQHELGVPIGLIHSSFGGTRIEAWMPPAAFTGDPALRGLEKTPYDHWVDGVQATELYRSMVAPFTDFVVRGFIWYQGETNCMNAEDSIYAHKQRALIKTWRSAWHEPDAPFYYVLLAPFAYSHQMHWTKQLTPEALPALWEAQERALDVPHTGLIATTDLAGSGKDIHPTDKRDVGLRLARLALADTYGRKDIAAHSPRFQAMKRGRNGNQIEIGFSPAETLHSRDGNPLTDFVVAGDNHLFQPATAVVEGDRVIVSSPLVAEPVAVRFAWNELAMPNLVNDAGLPVMPFRTDSWPLVLEVTRTTTADAAKK